MKIHLILITVVALFIGDVSAKPAGCPCSPCTCSPCSCGGGGGKHHDHARVGVGATVDLSGVGRRKAEADPFAVSSESSTTSRTEEKKAKKQPKESSSGNAFSGIQLTGEKAKTVTIADTNKP
jgi:hypothetical protein